MLVKRPVFGVRLMIVFDKTCNFFGLQVCKVAHAAVLPLVHVIVKNNIAQINHTLVQPKNTGSLDVAPRCGLGYRVYGNKAIAI